MKVQHSSLRNLIQKVECKKVLVPIQDLFRTIFMLLSNLFGKANEHLKNKIHLLNNLKNLEDPNLIMVIDRLVNKHGYTLNTSCLQTIASMIEQKSCDKCHFIIGGTLCGITDFEKVKPSILIKRYLDNLQRRGEKPAGLVCIPFVLSGPLNHIVIQVVDFDKKTVEYYDSRGKSPHKEFEKDLVDSSLLCFKGDEEANLLTSSNRHQKDIHNCGIYIADFVMRRLSGESFEDIENNGRSSKEIEKIRIDLAEQLADKQLDKREVETLVYELGSF